MDGCQVEGNGSGELQVVHASPDERIGGGKAKLVSTAQNFEDVMLWRAFHDVEQGFYIDVGAGDPDVESVTRTFYERNWQGINIEPAGQSWGRICAKRPRDINLRVAVGSTPANRKFFLIDGGGGLSTLREDIAAAHSSNGHSLDQIDCRVVTLADICENYVGRPIHFMKIDVEGAEREVLQGADFERYRPRVILVEATFPNSAVQTHREWEELLTTSGYRFAYFDGLNRFYIAEEFWERLAPAFTTAPNVFDNFIRADEAAALARAEAAEQQVAAATERAETAEQQVAAAMERTETAEALNCSLRSDLARSIAERDAYGQDLFESNRYAAFLTGTRQNLLDQVRAVTIEYQDLVRRTDQVGSENERLRAHSEQLYGDNERLHDDIARLHETVAHLTRWIDAVYASTSWKVARPLRGIKKMLRGGRT